MAVKKGNRRLTITFDKESLDSLSFIMSAIKTKQPTKAIRFALLEVKKRL